MRAQVRETTGYPYEQGDSDPLTLRVVPGAAKSVARKTAKAKRSCPKGRHAVRRRGRVSCVKSKPGASGGTGGSRHRPGAR